MKISLHDIFSLPTQLHTHMHMIRVREMLLCVEFTVHICRQFDIEVIFRQCSQHAKVSGYDLSRSHQFRQRPPFVPQFDSMPSPMNKL